MPEAATNVVVFADERPEIERLRHEDAIILINGGEHPSAHTGEEILARVAKRPWRNTAIKRADSLGQRVLIQKRRGRPIFLRLRRRRALPDGLSTPMSAQLT